MKYIKNPILAFLLALAFLALAGCSSRAEPNNSEAPSSEISASTLPPSSNSVSASSSQLQNEGDRIAEGQFADLIGIELRYDHYDKYDGLYHVVYDTIMPYMVTNAYYNLSYPNFAPEYQQSLLYYVALGMKDGNFDASFQIADYMDQGTGVYTIPKDLYDEALGRHLENMALSEEILIKEGYLLSDKSAYIIQLEGFGLVGRMTIGEIIEYDDNTIGLRLDVAFEEDGTPERSILFNLEAVAEDYYRIVKVMETTGTLVPE